VRAIFFLGICAILASCATVGGSSSDGFQSKEMTIAKLHHKLQQKELDCEQTVEAYIQRIKQFDQSTGLNAITLINPQALSRAKMLDQKYTRTKEMARLHCVPVLLKDNFSTKDMVTEGGSRALKGFIPARDSFIVRRLRENDAIIIAKTNMGEWAFSPQHTISSTHGETRNPYQLAHTPAGSSGGTAAGIAANFGLVGLGTDTGNSVRGPSSHTALVGMRASLGMVSRDGIIPLLFNRDMAGPMTRTVEDNIRVFEVIAGYDPADSYTAVSKAQLQRSYLPKLGEKPLSGIRLAVLNPLFESDDTHPEIQKLFNAATADLKQQGATLVTDFFFPEYDSLRSATGFCSRFRFDLASYLASYGQHAPIKSLDKVFQQQQFLPHNKGAMEWAMGAKGDPATQDPPCVDVQGDPRRQQFLDGILEAMAASKVDALIYPSWRYPPRKIGDNESPHGNNSGEVAPHTGQPAITVPMGYTQQGLPAGLQILGKPYAEALLYKIALAYESATQHRKPPPGF
jgi:amidase